MGNEVLDAIRSLSEQVTDIKKDYDNLDTKINSSVSKILNDTDNDPDPDTEVTTEKIGATDKVTDIRFMEYEKGDYEIARMLMESTHNFSREPIYIEPSERFMNAYHENLKDSKVFIADDKGYARAAMGTDVAGAGQALIGAQYLNSLWTSAKNMDTIVGDLQTIPMNHPTVHIPIDGKLPQMFLASEQKGLPSTNYVANLSSDTETNKLQMTSKKFTIQEIWSGELDEDAIIAFTPFIRRQLTVAFANELGSSIYNGDTIATNASINGSSARDGKENYLAYNGIRKTWINDIATRGVNAGGAVTAANFIVARSKLGGTAWTGSITDGKDLTNWGKDARMLRVIMDFETYLKSVQLEQVVTVDKYGEKATIMNGELASIYGMPIIVPSYAPKTEADGKLDDPAATKNTKGQSSIYNPDGLLGGIRRDATIYFDRIQGNDQYLLEFYTRRGLIRWGTGDDGSNFASGIYNITV